ncbi:MAG: glutaredoxin family protein, partial [Nitrososphaerota archaeon]|nr:glutaredoxin family protein [Nitrososphaerota archaeon]
LKALSSRKEFQLEIVDITQEQELLKTYMIRIPVIRLDGRDVLDAEDIALPLDSRSKLEDLVLGLQE